MTRWLAVTLMAPLASFGERAGNVERSTADRPTRSALIGLAGAALGVRRADSEGQVRLARSFRIATQTLGAGTLVADFHTYQSLPSSKGRPATRADALARPDDLATSITRREYRSDVWYEAAYAQNDGARWSLDELRHAFRYPVFTLFLGRKSCPLGAPLDARIDDAETVDELFARRRSASPYLDVEKAVFDSRARRHRAGPLAAERQDDLGGANLPVRRHRRMDEPGNRLTWQFSARTEFVRRPLDGKQNGDEP